MKKYLFYLSMALVAVVLFSCKGGKKSVFTPTSSGRAYEILVVVDNPVWERPAGRALYNVLDTDVPGLPQSERSFRIMSTSANNFDAILKLVRNIIIVDIQDIYSQPKFKYAKDVYASPHMILTIQAPDEATFEKFVNENKQAIIDFFTRAEMNRQISLLEKNHNDFISKKVNSTNTASADQNFVIYSYPYTDKDTFTKEFFIHKRDSVMKANIPGAKEGMYMSTDSTTVEVRPIDIHGDYTMEARGLWRMKGDFMGGPFVSHTRLDKANHRIVTVEVFIYSPDKLKRNLMRMLEASLYTLQLPTEKKQEQIPMGIEQEEKTNK